MFKSIFGRMFWTYAILLLLVISAISVSMTLMFSNYNERKEVESITTVAQTIETWVSELQIEQSDARSLKAYSQLLGTWSRYTHSDITIVNRDGRVLKSTCGIKSVPIKLLDCMEDGVTSMQKSDFGGFYEDRVLTVSFPVRYKGNIIGAILFNRNIIDLHKSVLEMLILFLFSSSIAIVFAVILIYIQARTISAPIEAINKAARSIASGNFGERVEVSSKDEIGQLASAFNFMASSIEKAERTRQRFISDVSHELRTPMTSISGFVQGMLDGTINDDKRDDYLKIVLDESTRLTRLVNDMLEMSKMQSENFKLTITPFDINELICTCLISHEKKIEERSLDVDVDFRPEKIIALGDKDQIKRVLINLLDNAVKFSHPGTVIQIHTSISGGKVNVSISNTGDGISDNDLRHIFDRFYKTDESRAKDRTGAGLGLSLVQNIIRLHNQTITASSTPDNDEKTSYTITFTFTLEVQ